eukprot:CAMPEP_0174866930 /NCGR_PEP_ID=MMETSP1114-20130205/63002_1 /TAXON_ID=312471 /ORGANISM="Neobodo designis, Strain CCAP 1951/1" /LENGTH=63 /DNA_ID=CAMNT_0016102103 /DNA_START=91 /DNA_END=278 /DNA_ORIENTATION=+
MNAGAARRRPPGAAGSASRSQVHELDYTFPPPTLGGSARPTPLAQGGGAPPTSGIASWPQAQR